MRNNTVLLLFVIGILSSVGCTKYYRPVSEWESTAIERSDKSIYPDDVRNMVGKYEEKMVAWPGIVESVNCEESDSMIVATYIIRHHYFDWIEVHGIVRPPYYYLSPSGEGLFTAEWKFPNTATDVEEIEHNTGKGTMMVTYGNPVVTNDGVLKVKTYYMRSLGKGLHTISDNEYGRATH